MASLQNVVKELVKNHILLKNMDESLQFAESCKFKVNN